MSGTFDDVVAEMRTALLPVSANIHTRTPNPRPESFLKLSQAGGNLLDQGVAAWVLVVVECWAPTNTGARDLAQSAMHAIMVWADTGNTIEDVEVTWPVYFPDPDSTNPRYTFNARCLQLTTD